MSQQISDCLVAKACTDSEAYSELLAAMRVNKAYGHWTQAPCRCTPPCMTAVTIDDVIALNERLSDDMGGLDG